jgi:uncharacterized protein (DUF486 family)
MILSFMPQALLPVLVLVASNICISFAWSGHLNFTQPLLWLIILTRWGGLR